MALHFHSNGAIRSSVLLAMVPPPQPIPWAAVLVSDGHDKHVILPDPIDDAEGKPRDDAFAILPAERGACRGAVGDAFNCIFHRSSKPRAQPPEARLVEES
jgi:hypothetical protein